MNKYNVLCFLKSFLFGLLLIGTVNIVRAGGATPSCQPAFLVKATNTYYQKLRNCLFGSAYASCIANCSLTDPQPCITNNCAPLKPLSDKYLNCLSNCGCDTNCVNENCVNKTGVDYTDCLSSCKCNVECAALTGNACNCNFTCISALVGCGCDFTCISQSCAGKSGSSYVDCLVDNCKCDRTCLTSNCKQTGTDAVNCLTPLCNCNKTCLANNCSNLKLFYDNYQTCVSHCYSYNYCIYDCYPKISLTGATLGTLMAKCRADVTNPPPLQQCAANKVTCDTAQACVCSCLAQESTLKSQLLPYVGTCSIDCQKKYPDNTIQRQQCQNACSQYVNESPITICSTPISQGGQGYSSCNYIGSCQQCPS
jgi:hypothetical protein